MVIVALIGAVVGASVIASFTDWLFMGVLFHGRYGDVPEIWRPFEREAPKIVFSEAIGVIACTGMVLLCAYTGATSLKAALLVGLFAWLAGPVPVIATNTVWIRMHPHIAASHAVGWLARFVITAGLIAWLT
jgi:hypothetical protein